MYVYFDMDEPTLLRTRKAINEGKIKLPENGTKMPGLHGPAGRGRLPAPGDDQLRQQPGQSHHRQHPGARRLCQPLAQGRPPAVVAGHVRAGSGCRSASPTRRCWSSIGPSASDQGLKYVYVLDADNKVQYRRVTTGPLQDDGLRVIEQGLKPDDWVVVGGLQQVRPRMTVKPERVPMPTFGPPNAAVSILTAQEPARRELQRPAVAGRIRQDRTVAVGTNQALRGASAMISRFFIDRPIFATVLSVVITLIGGIALYFLPIAQYPRITPPGVAVSISYPGPAPRWWPTRWRRRSSSRSTASRACSTCPRRWATTARTR